MFLFQFAINSEPLIPFGMFACAALLALAVNDRVVETYEERDYLRTNLEKEVERQTLVLKKQSTELEMTMSSLKSAQADLVQSAKLAALGTLSAGIAHEINNALNYVNGSIDPIANILKKDQLTEADKNKGNRLLKLMKEGLDLTFGIIVNLKRHTSSGAEQLESLSVKEVVDGALLLLKNKLTGLEVITDIDPSLKLRGTRVSLSQILMNLLSNAADSIEEKAAKNPLAAKKITIQAGLNEKGRFIAVTDSGLGIDAELKSRIFDPFFTTKTVGKGTGLGLHIVLSEMKKQGGSIEIESTPGEGAKFLLLFPDAAEEMAA